MPNPIVDEVLGLIGNDDNVPRLAEVLRDLDDKQRKALSGPVQKHAEATWLNRDGQGASAIAVLGCVTGVRQAAARLEWLSIEGDAEAAAVDVLAARQPHWLPALPEALLVGRERPPHSFRLVRALVRAGGIDPPDFPEYVLAMVRGLTDRHSWLDGPTVLDCLRQDPGLLDTELWNLFTTEGAGKLLTSHDGWLLKPYQQPGDGPTIPARPKRTWHHAILSLAAEGAIDRARLLDATLAAFFRDWTAGDIGWFVKLHDGIEPTIDEMANRQTTYGRLLSLDPGPPVNLGLRTINTLLAGGRLNLDVLFANLAAVLTRRDKGPAMDGLKLVAEAAKVEPKAIDRAVEAASSALNHERVEVQERALALITKLVPDSEQRNALVSAYSDALAPSLRPQSVAATPDPAEPRPRIAEPLEPVRDADELGELLARLVEEADDPAEVERLLEGTARLARQLPNRGVDALIKRLDHLAGNYYPGAWFREELRADLVQLGLVWLARRSPGRGYAGRQYAIDYQQRGGVMHGIARHRADWSLAGLVTTRIHEVAVAVASGGATLLAFPTRRDGTLDREALNARVKSLGRMDKPLPLDAGLALLRVDPQDYSELRLPSAHRTAKALLEQLQLLRDYQPAWELVRGDSKGVYRHDVFNGALTWRDTRAAAGSEKNIVAAVLDRRDPLLNLALEAADGEYTGRFDQVTATWPLMLPHHPDLLAAHAHPRLNRALTKNRSGTEPLLDALGAATRAVGPPTMSALVLGLAAKNGVERTRAIDALVDLSSRTMLDGAGFGSHISALLTADVVVGSRIVPGLADASRGSGRAATITIDCLTAALPGLSGRRDAHLFIDLLAQLAIQQDRTVSLPQPFADLASSKQSSMLAKACRRVPQPA